MVQKKAGSGLAGCIIPGLTYGAFPLQRGARFNGAFPLQRGARFKRAVSCRARFWLH